MNLAGRILSLLLLVLDVDAFTSVSVSATNAEISVVTSYVFTLYTFGGAMSQGDVITTSFPAQVPITDVTIPSVCNRLDSVLDPLPLVNCAITSGNVVSFALDANVSDTLMYVLGLAQNPNAVITTSNFSVQVSGSVTDSWTSTLVATYTPGKLSGLSLASSTIVVYAQATYTITLTPQHDIPQNGLIYFSFPSDFQIGSPTVIAVTGKVNSAAAVSLTATEPQSTLVQASGLFSSAGLSAAIAPVITMTVYPVNNPDSMRTSASLTVYTALGTGDQIDTGSSGLTVTPTIPQSLTNLIVAPNPTTVLKSASYAFTVSPAISFPSGGKLTFAVPTSITIGTVSCSFTVGFKGSGSCSVSGQLVSTSGVYYVKSASASYLVFTVNGFTNPPDTTITANFQFNTYDSLGYLMCQNLAGPQVQTTTNVLTVNTATRTSALVTAAGPYKLTFTLTTKIPQYAVIKIVLPQDQVLQSSGIVCNVVTGGTTLPSNICSGTVTIQAGTYTIQVTEWCSSGPSGCPASTQLSLSFGETVNPSYVKTPITSSVAIYTYNAAMIGGIDAISTGVVFTPALQAATIVDGAVSRQVNVVGQDANFFFSFTPPVPFLSAAVIIFTFPQSVAFPDASGLAIVAVAVNSSFGNPVALTFTGPSQYSDNSYQSISITSACTSGCVSSTTLYFELSNIQNPTMVKLLSTSYTISVTSASGFQIASGSPTSTGVAALQPDTISSIVLSRSSQYIQTAVSLSLSFVHATVMSTTSQINLTFPDNLVVVGTTLTCTRLSDNAALTYTQTLYSSGAINTLAISGYCSIACLKGGTIQVVFGGLVTLNDVEPITGLMSITTTDQTYLIDQGSLADVSTQISTLLPGTLINVSILQANPTVAATTSYRIIFTSAHSIPKNAQVQVTFPAEISIGNSCSAYILVNAGLSCSVTSSVLTLTSAFLTSYSGSWMVGFIVGNMGNSAVQGTSNPIVINLLTSSGYLIDSGSATVSFSAAVTTCASSCLTCAGSSTTCDSCANPGVYPIQNGFTCVQTCPSSTFLVSSPSPLSCVSCHYTCSSCGSSLSTACYSCASGLYQSNQSCVSQCPSGTALTAGICVNNSPCSSPCVTCSTSSSFCLSCGSASAFPVLDSVNGMCVATQVGNTDYCPPGYYQSGLQCQACGLSCATCLNSSNHCTSCPTVYGTPYLNAIDNTCVGTCPVGVTVLVGNTCVQCDSSCATCNGTTSSSCLTCPSTGTKYMTSTNQCVSVCPASSYYFDNTNGTFACVSCNTVNGYYIDTVASYCRSCFTSCLTCSGGGNTNCLSCSTTGAYPYIGVDGECLAVCPSTQYSYSLNGKFICYISCPTPSYNFVNGGNAKVCVVTCPLQHYFVDTGTNTCTPCYSSCLTCTGSAQNSCTSCDITGTTPFYTDTNYCEASCPANMYIYTLNSNKKCYTTCPTGSYNYDNTVAGNLECKDSCGPGFWVDVPSNTCGPCYSACQTCTGGTNQQCATCNTAGTTPYLTYQNACVAQCPSNLFISGYTCLQTCPVGTSYNYQNPGGFGQCISACTDGFWVDTSSNYCKPCYLSCATCSGGTNVNCSSCNTSGTYPYLTYTGQCVAMCPSTSFIYTLNGMMKCLSTCPTGTYYFVNADNSVQCVSSCNTSNKFYIDSTTMYCSPCFTNCLTCQGSTNTNCLSCDLTSAVPFLTADGQCLSSCPTVQFAYTYSGLKNCYLSCPVPTYNYIDGSGNAVCTNTCATAANYFINTSANFCSPCYQSCLTCFAASSNSCLTCDATGSNPLFTADNQCVSSCPSNMYLNNSQCLITCPGTTYYYTDQSGLQKCVTTCNTGFYLDIATSHCYQCYSTCLTCSGIAINNCVSCNTSGSFPYLSDGFQCLSGCGSLFLYTLNSSMKCYTSCPSPSYNYNDSGVKRCIATCGTGFYINTTNNYCQPCDPTCLSCNGSSNASCLACDTTGLFPYLTDGNQCVSQCSTVMYIYTLNSEMRCYTSCPAGSYNYDNPANYKQCISTCGGGLYIDASANYCRPCYSTCNSCNGTTYLNCLSCNQGGATPYLTDTGECVAQCPAISYQFTLNGNMKCFSSCPLGSYNFQTSGGMNECIATCGTGYYIDTSNNYCRPCDGTCLTCKDTTNTGCLTCTLTGSYPYLSYTGQCLAQCPTTVYRYELNGYKECLSQCPGGSYGFSNPSGYLECISSCDPGYYLNQVTNICQICYSTCLTCSGVGSTDCLSCSSSGSYPYLSDTHQCLTQCGSLYQDTLNGSMLCYTKCPVGTYGYQTGGGLLECVSTCGPGFYLNTMTSMCYNCDVTCKTCIGTTNANCATCDSTGSYPYLTDGNQCVSQCGSLYQYTIGGSMNCYTTCPTGSYGFAAPGGLLECITTCATGFYLDTVANICYTCDSTCLTCIGVGNTKCSTCSASGSTPYLSDSNQCLSQCGLLYQYTLNGSMRCFSICPVGTLYYNNPNGTNQCVVSCDPIGNFVDLGASFCRPCDRTCATCNGTQNTACVTCTVTGAFPFLTDSNMCVTQCPSTMFQYELNGNFRCYTTCPSGSLNYASATRGLECISTCPSGNYIDVPNNYCRPCDLSCLSCMGTSSSSCLSCDKSGLTGFYTANNQCVAVCPPTLYIYNPNGEKLCLTTCPSGSYNFDNMLGYKECRLSCGIGFYIDSGANYCRPCYQNCRTCNGGANTNCVTCDKLGPAPYLTEDQQCLASCVSTSFIYSPSGQMECVVACPSPYYNYYDPLGYGDCVATCGGGFYVDTASNYCKPCYFTCKTCDAGTSLSCYTCDAAGTYPYLTDTGECVSKCSSQFFYYTLNGLKLCLSACPPDTYSYLNPLGYKECIATCSGKYYVNSVTLYCSPCYPSCLTCSGSLATSCLTCDPLGMFPYTSTDGQCVSICPANEYIYVFQGLTKCYVTCPPGTYSLDLGGKQCVTTCPSTTFQSGVACLECDLSCSTCTGGANYNCITCKVGYIYFHNQCLETCPKDYKASLGSCIPACSQLTCAACEIATLYSCQVCVPGYILYNYLCFEMCPEGTFETNSTCELCDQSCGTCKDAKSTSCTSCNQGTYLYIGTCVMQCPTGLKPINGRCQVPVPCEAPCSSCIDNTADLCSDCLPSAHLLVGTSCYDSCPDHYYPANNTACGACANTCLTCSGPFLFNCVSCPESPRSYLTPSYTCNSICPAHYFPNNSTGLCQHVDTFPLPPVANITIPNSIKDTSLLYLKSDYYSVSTLGIGFLAVSGVVLVSKFAFSASHLSDANLLALYSAIDMGHRAGLIVSLWRYGDISPAPFEIAVCAGLVVGSVSLSMMFLVLYMDPVFESSASLDSLASRHKWGLRILRLTCYLFGLHFIRLLYGGLFGLSLFSNFKTLGNSSGFRLPLEKLSSIHLIALLIPQVLQNVTILLFYEIDSDPFQLSALGIGVNLAIAGIYLLDYYRSPWRV